MDVLPSGRIHWIIKVGIKRSLHMRRKYFIYSILGGTLILSIACNLASSPANSITAIPPSATVNNAAPPSTGTDTNAAAQPGSTATLEPLVATVLASHHILTPVDISAGGPINYDVDSSGTASENRAPYGDSYNINLFERPFTQTVMNYLPELDIITFRLTQDADWYYVSMSMTGGDMNDPIGVNYGVELDTDHDGFGDYLVWASPPYTTKWLAETVQVYKDTNHDTGGASAERSDAVFPGNGYDSIIFDRGQGTDPDLAWVRLDPQVASSVQFAFKRSLAGNAFMWGVWADAGLRDPSKFNYNDRFTEAQAGSPIKNKPDYPIKAIYQVDNTCWVAQGFKPTGDEPHLCPSLEPQPTHQPKAGPTPSLCVPWWACLHIIFPTPIPPPK
jgi:hypothetical protein